MINPGLLTHLQNINDRPLAVTFFATLTGMTVGAACALVFFSVNPIWMLLVPLCLLMTIPVFILKDVPSYWLALFLFSLQFNVKKNLIDPLPFINAYGSFPPYVFVPEIYISDLVFAILLVYWLHSVFLHQKQFYFPPASWLAIGFLGWAALSMLKANDSYLSVLELVRQCKFLLIYLYAANNLGSKRSLKVIFLVLLATLVLQGTITVVRYQLQYYEPILGEALGRTDTLAGETEQLIIDPSVGEMKLSFGTLNPVTMGKYFLLILPLSLLLCAKNPIFAIRWIFIPITLIGLAGLFLTYSRTNFIAFGAELVLCFYFAVRRGYFSQKMALLWLFVAAFGGLALTPTVYKFMDRKFENVEIRFAQYDTAFSMIQSNPLLGVGLNNNLIASKAYNQHSFSPRSLAKQASDHPIHSLYLSLLVEIGIVGFILYLAFFFEICRETVRAARAPSPQIQFAATFILIAILGLGVGILWNPLFEESVQSIVWLFAGVSIALGRSLPCTTTDTGRTESLDLKNWTTDRAVEQKLRTRNGGSEGVE
jgi:O-antigen ligase